MGLDGFWVWPAQELPSAVRLFCGAFASGPIKRHQRMIKWAIDNFPDEDKGNQCSVFAKVQPGEFMK